jgi:CheY-like chemotaxis protein
VDVVLLDLGLPDGDGHDLADELRCQPSFYGTELIAITGTTDPTRRARSIEAGFAAHLQKPYAMEELWSALSRVGPVVRAQ